MPISVTRTHIKRDIENIVKLLNLNAYKVILELNSTNGKYALSHNKELAYVQFTKVAHIHFKWGCVSSKLQLLIKERPSPLLRQPSAKCFALINVSFFIH